LTSLLSSSNFTLYHTCFAGWHCSDCACMLVCQKVPVTCACFPCKMYAYCTEGTVGIWRLLVQLDGQIHQCGPWLSFSSMHQNAYHKQLAPSLLPSGTFQNTTHQQFLYLFWWCGPAGGGMGVAGGGGVGGGDIHITHAHLDVPRAVISDFLKFVELCSAALTRVGFQRTSTPTSFSYSVNQTRPPQHLLFY
jgi:hypothetical protein